MFQFKKKGQPGAIKFTSWLVVMDLESCGSTT